MATKKQDESAEVTGEETEPEPFVDPEGEDEFYGIPGQIQYPDPHVDAERAAAFAGGKVDHLDPRAEDDPAYESGWENPADRPNEEQVEDDEEKTE
jgi:hypothetical protein